MGSLVNVDLARSLGTGPQVFWSEGDAVCRTLGILELRRLKGKRSNRREDAEATGRVREEHGLLRTRDTLTDDQEFGGKRVFKNKQMLYHQITQLYVFQHVVKTRMTRILEA